MAPMTHALSRAIVLTGLLLAGLILPAGQGSTAELKHSRYTAVPPVVGPHPPVWRYNGPPQPLPFARSERSASVWASDACWNDCRASCAWDLNGCLHYDSQGTCILYSAACDRYCQRDCRTQGGPLLPFD
jgi:hypothetical protein